MPLRSKLTVKQGQRLVMTPSLQNSLRILQLNQQELAQELQELLLSNIMLEAETDYSMESVESDFDRDEAIMSEEALDLDRTDTTVEMEEYGDYFNDDHSTSLSRPEHDDQYDPLNLLTDAHQSSTEEDLLSQLRLSDLDENERFIAEIIIREINDDGYLLTPMADLIAMLDDLYDDISDREIEPIIAKIQQFDPPGIAARSVEESMIIQIDQFSPRPEWATDAIIMLTKGVDSLVRVDIKQLGRLIEGDEARVREVLHHLQYLNPRPGYKIGGSEQQGITPDLIVTFEADNQLKISLNESIVPRLRINPFYQGLIRKMQKKEGMMSEHLAEARNVIRNIGSRFDTLLMVGREIIEYQKAYFFEGDRALRPLQLKDIAEKLDFNESTISRAVAGKYILCPDGILALNFFFSNQVASTNSQDEDASAVAIRAVLQSIVDGENPEKPYSDSALAKLLEEAGHKVARRTVAKYRELLNIPSSTNRRSVAR